MVLDKLFLTHLSITTREVSTCFSIFDKYKQAERVYLPLLGRKPIKTFDFFSKPM